MTDQTTDFKKPQQIADSCGRPAFLLGIILCIAELTVMYNIFGNIRNSDEYESSFYSFAVVIAVQLSMLYIARFALPIQKYLPIVILGFLLVFAFFLLIFRKYLEFEEFQNGILRFVAACSVLANAVYILLANIFADIYVKVKKP